MQQKYVMVVANKVYRTDFTNRNTDSVVLCSIVSYIKI